MLRKFRISMIILCAFALTFLSLGIITLIPTHAKASLSTADAIAEFAMENGAAIRKSTDKQGIRFNAILSVDAYDTLKNADAEFGMLIVPKDYVDKGYDLTVENVFGENAVYVPNVNASTLEKTDPDKRAIIQITNPTITQVGNVYKIYGSIVGVLEKNIPRGFIGRAYVKVNDTYYLASYANDLIENNTRSMAYIAKRAIDNLDAGSATLQNTYITKVEDKSYDYTVNKITIKLDGSSTTEVLEEGTAKFGTEIIRNAETRFGVESFGVDSFVGMENAKFNVVYKEIPVDVVVDANANQTELYAANELASYIEQVTGKAVYVGTQKRTTNNIYVSTDTSLNLNMDSFKLSTDGNGNIHINGTDDRGTLYGVYEYEEQNLGIKFLTEEYTYVPVTNNQISSLSDSQKRTYEPAFNYRTYMNNSIGLDGDNNVKYSSHLRFIAQFSQEKSPTELMNQVQYFMPWMAKSWLSASHSLLTYAAVGAWVNGLTELVDVTTDSEGYITSIKFKETAPKNKTYGTAIDDTVSHMLDICYSNAYAKEWVTEGLKYMIDTYGKDYEYFMLGQADKTTECDCSTCQKAIVSSINNWWNPKKNKADLTATFIKDVITTVNGYGVSKCGEKYSDNKIVMFAYQKTEPAPKNEITGMPDNVYIQWAPIDQDRYFPLSNSNPNGWNDKTGIDKFMVWSYETNFQYYFNYYPTMHTWIENFQTYKDLGVEAIMMQSTWNTAGVADSYLDAYVASKLLWNFKEDSTEEMQAIIDSAKDEFIQYFYGDAAKDYILQYYKDFDALYETKFGSKGYLDTTWKFTTSELSPLLDLINQAIAKTTDATYLAHLKMLSFTTRYMLSQYCNETDDTLLADMNDAEVTRSREGMLIEDDDVLDGFIAFKKGSTEVTTMEKDANGRIIHLTLEIPDNQEWSSNSASFTADFMSSLYADGVRTLQMYSSSTANTGNTIYHYGDASYNYDCNSIENVTLTADGKEFKFCYVDVSGTVHGQGGFTIGTTLDLYFNYLTENQKVQDEIGMTLGEGVNIFKNPVSGIYVISDTNGDSKSAHFDANKVNEWINQGYKAIKLTTEFTTSNTIDQVVGFDTAYKTNNSGYSEWTFFLNKDTPIKLWAQKNQIGNSGAFIISNVELLTDVEPYQTNYAKLVSRSYNEDGRLMQLVVEIPNGTNWWENHPVINADYLNDLYLQGVKQVVIDATSTVNSNNFFTHYGSTDTTSLSAKVQLVKNSPELQFSYVNLGAGGVTVGTTLTLNFTYVEGTPEEIAAEIGATLNGDTTIAKNNDGSYTVSNAIGNNEGLEFTAEQVNEWISQGYTHLSMTISFITVNNLINKTIVWSSATGYLIDESGSKVWLVDLNPDTPICVWTQFNNDPLSGSSFNLANLALETHITSNGYASISNVQYDSNGRIAQLTATFTNGSQDWGNNMPAIASTYLYYLYMTGTKTIQIYPEGNSHSLLTQYNGIVDYDGTYVVELVENGGALEFSHVDVSAGGYIKASTLTLNFEYDISFTTESVARMFVGSAPASTASYDANEDAIRFTMDPSAVDDQRAFAISPEYMAKLREVADGVTFKVKFLSNTNPHGGDQSFYVSYGGAVNATGWWGNHQQVLWKEGWIDITTNFNSNEDLTLVLINCTRDFLIKDFNIIAKEIIPDIDENLTYADLATMFEGLAPNSTVTYDETEGALRFTMDQDAYNAAGDSRAFVLNPKFMAKLRAITDTIKFQVKFLNNSSPSGDRTCYVSYGAVNTAGWWGNHQGVGWQDGWVDVTTIFNSDPNTTLLFINSTGSFLLRNIVIPGGSALTTVHEYAIQQGTAVIDGLGIGNSDVVNNAPAGVNGTAIKLHYCAVYAGFAIQFPAYTGTILPEYSVSFRIYAESSAAMMDLWFYDADHTAPAGNGCDYKASSIATNKWVDITISFSDLAGLLDSEGEFKGFQFGIFSTDVTNFYIDSLSIVTVVNYPDTPLAI